MSIIFKLVDILRKQLIFFPNYFSATMAQIVGISQRKLAPTDKPINKCYSNPVYVLSLIDGLSNNIDFKTNGPIKHRLGTNESCTFVAFHQLWLVCSNSSQE